MGDGEPGISVDAGLSALNRKATTNLILLLVRAAFLMSFSRGSLPRFVCY